MLLAAKDIFCIQRYEIFHEIPNSRGDFSTFGPEKRPQKVPRRRTKRLPEPTGRLTAHSAAPRAPAARHPGTPARAARNRHKKNGPRSPSVPCRMCRLHGRIRSPFQKKYAGAPCALRSPPRCLPGGDRPSLRHRPGNCSRPATHNGPHHRGTPPAGKRSAGRTAVRATPRRYGCRRSGRGFPVHHPCRGSPTGDSTAYRPAPS